jgi:hypothetical protein
LTKVLSRSFRSAVTDGACQPPPVTADSHPLCRVSAAVPDGSICFVDRHLDAALLNVHYDR